MASIQHVYRRGHIFWWRRVLRLFNDQILDIRISLRTADRQRAREVGAVLTASSGSVQAMLEEKVRGSHERPTEAELAAIAKAEYEYLLARVSDQQREHPQHHAMHAAANAAYADYYQRMIDTGGRPEISDEEKAWLLQQGWTTERIERLIVLIGLHADRPAISQRAIHAHLREINFEPTRQLIAIVRRALFPAYRDAVLAAQGQLESMRTPLRDTPAEPADERPPASPESPTSHRVETEPVLSNVLDPSFGELCRMAADDLLLEGTWVKKTADQRRTLGLLFDLIVGKKNVSTLTQADLSTFKTKRRLITEKLSPADPVEAKRILELTSRQLSPAELKDLNGPHAKTINRDLTGISAVFRWGGAHGVPVPNLKLSGLRVPLPAESRARDDRAPTSEADLRKLFNLPIYTGCVPHNGGRGRRVLKCRFTSGPAVVHDAFYWVPLLVTYQGLRREEACKFMPGDFCFDDPIPFLKVSFTETGRLKNAQSKRNLPLHPELLRLGIQEFVEEAARRGYRELFPELAPTNAVESYGDQFYDLCWTHLRKHGELSAKADIHGVRHAFNSSLKQKRVSKEFRRDMLGHGGDGQTDERYATAAELTIMLEEMQKLPNLTAHLQAAKLNMPPKPTLRPNPNMRRR